MKKVWYVLPLAAMFVVSCGESSTAETSDSSGALETIPDTNEDFEAQAHSFADGEASTGEEYFKGVLAEVIEVDVKIKEVDVLDEQDAPVEEFHAALDASLERIKEARTALDKYTDKTWPKRQELHDLTIEWFASVEGLVNNHLRGLVPQYAKPDDQWTDKENKLYDAYLEAYDGYLDVDTRWVEFQDVFAAANGFTLSDETIDVDALVEEDMAGH